MFVTGKGGVGKTTVAAALARSAADAGRRVLVSDMDGRGDLADAFGLGPIGFDPTQAAPGLFVMSMDTEASLAEYLRLQLRVPLVRRLGSVAAAFDFVANAAPGVAEILRVGKFAHEVRQAHYDLVVVDSPATGHIVGHLAAADAIGEIVRFGPVRNQTAWMTEMLSDPAVTGTVVVATPEEMPVTEIAELRQRLADETHVEVAAIVANRVPAEAVGADEVELDADDPGAAAVLAAARFLVARHGRAAGHLDELRAIAGRQTPMVELPDLAPVVGHELVDALAGMLA